jgi:hypothetical protein
LHSTILGAPLGNRNGEKQNRLWGDAIRRAVVQDDGKRLRMLAERLLDKAAEGDVSALKELGDRLDGKSPQALTDADGNPLTLVFQLKDERVL